MKILSLYDVTGIQRYIFGSNHLRLNVGASYLVHLALKCLHGIVPACRGNLIFCGGGNALAVFTSREDARRAALGVSRLLHQQARGLHIAALHGEWDKPVEFAVAYQDLQRQLRAQRQGALADSPFDGGGVTAQCSQDGSAAVSERPVFGLLGVEAQLKQEWAPKRADIRLRKIAPIEPYVYTNVIDHLGRTHGERSMIGVVHVDGNGMGSRFKDAAKAGPGALSALSEAVERAGENTLRMALAWVRDNLPGLSQEEQGVISLFTDQQTGETSFPVRPIVFGGDDITLVCDGRLAIDLAARLLLAWHEATANLPDGKGAAHACAGVAICGAHYPFYRAYRIAEDLCRRSKRYLKRHNLTDRSALDYEIFDGGTLISVEQRRKLDVAADGNQLHARPYFVVGQPPSARPHLGFPWLRRDLIKWMREQDEARTQFKLLAEILPRGRDQARDHLRRLRDRHGLCLPPEGSNLAATGFATDETPYLDAIELLDRIIPLELAPYLPPPQGADR